MITYPFDSDTLLNRQKSIRRRLLERQDITYLSKRIAILDGSTTSDIKNLLEIFLLDEGIRPEFYESDYNKFYEDAVFGNTELETFSPEIIIVFTTIANITNIPSASDTPEDAEAKINDEFKRYKTIWENLKQKFSAVIIQNNFDFPAVQPEGSFDAVYANSLEHFVNVLNEKFSLYAREHSGIYIHDIHRLSAKTGLDRWHNMFQYCSYKFAVNYDVMPSVAWSIKKIVCAVLGRIKKCLVLDLDNTLWGGIIGEEGLAGISLGSETPEGEAFTYFQRYVKGLKDRGIILAVNSKNDEDTAKSGFTHPDSVLKLDDFAAFRANWNPKDQNIRQIAHELNIGLDSMVFIDDSPAERAIVRENVPEVCVPDFDPEDIFSCIKAIEENGFFETVAISPDDMKRNDTYRQNRQRQELEIHAESYDDFLKSLDMQAEIEPFREIYFDRITQLTNKTNQFNLTTRRYTLAEIQNAAESPENITLSCRLRDRFGDNGIISLAIGEIHGEELHIILWLMSCRVLRRGVEDLMLDCIAREAAKKGCTKLTGYYFRTKKNSMAGNLYRDFGFSQISSSEEGSIWKLDITDYVNRNKFIREV